MRGSKNSIRAYLTFHLEYKNRNNKKAIERVLEIIGEATN